MLINGTENDSDQWSRFLSVEEGTLDNPELGFDNNTSTFNQNRTGSVGSALVWNPTLRGSYFT